jgi:hypothetical protein
LAVMADLTPKMSLRPFVVSSGFVMAIGALDLTAPGGVNYAAVSAGARRRSEMR